MALLGPSEEEIQIAIMQWVSLHKELDDYVFHIGNERKCSFAYGKRLKKMGVKRGVADLFIAIPKGGYHGAWIEVKSEAGFVSTYQSDFLRRMKSQGYYTFVVYSIEEGIDAIKYYCQMTGE